MAASVEPLLRQLHRLIARPDLETANDAVLLERFVTERDEAAFAALLARHGPMVLGVCRRVLHDAHDTEDVFQAVFLVLAHKARSVRRPQSLAAWLYGTARHLAWKVRRRDGRRRQREIANPPSATPSSDPLDQLAARELLLVLDEEIERLPQTQRLALLLCGLQGRSHEEAARQLGWTVGSLKGRLERGRKRLHSRLVSRGLAFSGALLTLEISQAGTAGAATRLSATMLRVLRAFAQGQRDLIAPNVLALTESALAGATAAKVKMGLMLLLAASLAIGTGALAHQALTIQPLDTPQEKQDKRTPQPAALDNQARVDPYGDPLPAGALARMGTMRFRHVGDVISLAFSPDGKIIASGQRNEGPIVLWDAASGKELRRIEEEPNVRGDFAFAPDGKLLALVKWGESVGLWDVVTGKLVRRFNVPAGGCVTFSADGKMLGVPIGNQVALLDAVSGKERDRLPAHPERIVSLAFSPDGKYVAAGGDGKSACLWDVRTKQQLHVLQGHTQQVPGLAFSADSKTLATASFDRTARLWDVATGKEQRRFAHKERADDVIQTVHFVPNHPWLVTGSVRSIRVWDLDTGKEIRRFPGHYCMTGLPVSISPDGTKLVTRGGEQGRIDLWDLVTGKQLYTPQGHQRPIGCVTFSPDGQTLATGSWDETLRLWDATSGRELRRVRVDFDVQVTFLPDGKTLGGSSSDGFVRFWDAATGKELRRFLAHKEGIGRLVFAADGKTCFTASVNRMEFAKDGQTMVALPTDTMIRRWRVDSGMEIGRFEGLDKAAWGLALAPDGKTLLSVVENTARLWDVATGKVVRPFRAQQGSLGGSIVYSPDGKTVAATEENLIHLWNLATGEEVRRFTGHSGSIHTVRFSPDGRTLASASSDRTVRLWEVSSGQERHRFEGHRHAVFTLAFSRDGRRLASASVDASALIWDVWGLVAAQRAETITLSPKKLEHLWTALGDTKNAAAAYQAMCRLLRDPAGTMRLFGEKVRPVPATDEAQIARWIDDLDSAEFAVREKAARELAERGDAVEAALRKASEDRPSLEVRQRLKLLLDKLQNANRLRMLRAVEVLEQLGTAEARQQLEALAKGAVHARLTQDARAALQRIAYAARSD